MLRKTPRLRRSNILHSPLPSPHKTGIQRRPSLLNLNTRVIRLTSSTQSSLTFSRFMTSSTFGAIVSSLIKSGTSPLSLWTPSIRFHLIKPPYSQTSQPPFLPANLLCSTTTILPPLTPAGKNTVFFWGSLAQANHKYSSAPFLTPFAMNCQS